LASTAAASRGRELGDDLIYVFVGQGMEVLAKLARGVTGAKKLVERVQPGADGGVVLQRLQQRHLDADVATNGTISYLAVILYVIEAS
jgi:hypothetical protein